MLHDEIATFFYYIQTNDFLPPKAHWDANNHVLNSFLSSLSFQLFGDAPWALRLPNVAMYPIYIYFSWKVAAKIQSSTIRWTLFLSLVSTTYTFEYFALSRGYGMSLGFMIWGVFLFLKNMEKNTVFGYLSSIFILFLAVSANLTLIYVYLMIVVLVLFKLFMAASKSTSRKLIHVFFLTVFSTVLAFPLIYFSFELKSRGALYYGGNSFINFTLKPIVQLLFGSDSLVLIYLVVLLFLSIFLAFIFLIIKGLKISLIEKQLFTILLSGGVAAILLSHYILGVNFPEDRTAMYLIPLFFLSVCFTLAQLNLKYTYLIALPLLFIPIKFIGEIHVNNALFAIEERHIQAYFDYIEQNSKNQAFKPTIGGYATQSFCWYYMNYRSTGAQNAMLYSTHPDTICEYQILNNGIELSAAFNLLYTKINSSPLNKHNLFRRNEVLKQKHLLTQENITNWNHSNNEFLNLAELEIAETWTNKAFLVEITGIIHAARKPFYSTLSLSQKDANWAEISQERAFLSWMRHDWSDDTKKFTQRLILPNINKDAKHLQIFLWNIKTQPFLIKNCTVRVYLLY